MRLTQPRRTRRTHSEAFKQSLIEACGEPGASVAGVAMANGINANRKRSATPSTPGSRNSVLVSTPNGVDTCPLQFLLNSASAYACPAVGQ